MNLFIDTNVLMDILATREEFYADSERVWSLVETGRVKGFVSALTVANLHYLLRRAKGLAAARSAVGVLRNIFALVPLDAQVVREAIEAEIDDFEDAIQFFSALRAEADVLITRNARHFPTGDLPIQAPGEFLAAHFPED